MGFFGALVWTLLALLVVGGLLVLTDVLPLEALGGALLWVAGVLLLVGIVAALALAVRGLLFRVRGTGRGGRFT